MLAVESRAASTLRAYATDWADFSGWCRLAGRDPLPASSETVQAYLVSQARAGKAAATIARRVAALAAQHGEHGHATPVDEGVRVVMGGLRRRIGTAQKGKAALALEDLARVVAACPATVAGARDRALLLFGFASGLRRSELAALQLADIDEVPRGLVVRLGRSKTDQEGHGRELGIHRGLNPATCPARAVAAWLEVRGRWPGALFCFVDRYKGVVQRAIKGEAVGDLVKAACERGGLDPARYAGHSLRAGCATAASANGADTAAIMARTGHKNAAMVGRYVRHANLFAVDPLAGVL